MVTVTIHQAKTNLSKLIARVEAGEDIVIARGRNPVVRLTAVAPTKRKLTFGVLKDQYPGISDSFFFDPLPDEEIEAWEGRHENPSR